MIIHMRRTRLLATTSLVSAMVLASPALLSSETAMAAAANGAYRLQAGEDARNRRLSLAMRYASILDVAARALAEHASSISDDTIESHYAEAQPLDAAHAPRLTASQRELLDEIGARFVVNGGWITAIAPQSGFPSGVAVTDIREATEAVTGRQIDLYSSTGALGSGGGIARPDLPDAHSEALAEVGPGVGRSVPFERWNGERGTRTVTQRRAIPCGEGEYGPGHWQERTVAVTHWGDGTTTTPEGGWETTHSSCTPETSYTFAMSRPCPNGEPGDVYWEVTRETLQDPDDPWGFIVVDTPGPERERCGVFTEPGTIGEVERETVYDQALNCPAGSQGTPGRHRFVLATARLAGQGHEITGAFVEGRRIETIHQAPVCRWTACGTSASTASFTIADVPADMATLRWTVAAGPTCQSNSGNDDNDDREDTNYHTGVDRDGDGDIDLTLTEANDPDRDIEFDEDDVITKREDELTTDDFRDDDNDNDNSGGGGGGCFLTTAVTQMRGEADDGPTLTTLRQFRDGWLSGRMDGEAMIAEYYAVAPGIVAAIPPDDPEWLWIADRIDLAVEAMHGGKPATAFDIYAGMFRRLQERWL